MNEGNLSNNTRRLRPSSLSFLRHIFRSLRKNPFLFIRPPLIVINTHAHFLLNQKSNLTPRVMYIQCNYQAEWIAVSFEQ